MTCSKPQKEAIKQLAYLGNLFEIQQQLGTTDLKSQPGDDVANNKTAILLGHFSRNDFYACNSSSFSYYYQDVDPLFIPHSSQSQQLLIETVVEYNADENGLVKECHPIIIGNCVPKMPRKIKRKNMDQHETQEGRIKKKLKQKSATLIGINIQTTQTPGCHLNS
jgi:hypothetical protein